MVVVACPVDVGTAAVVVVDGGARDAIVADVLNRLKRDVSPPPTPSAGTEPISLPVWDVLVVCGLLAGAVVVLLVICAATVVAEELSRLKRDVLPPPMPTAGTLPSSVPFPVAVAGSVAVTCRGTWKVIGLRLLAAYRTGRSFALLTALDFLWVG
jgi:hypothetical protein